MFTICLTSVVLTVNVEHMMLMLLVIVRKTLNKPWALLEICFCRSSMCISGVRVFLGSFTDATIFLPIFLTSVLKISFMGMLNIPVMSILNICFMNFFVSFRRYSSTSESADLRACNGTNISKNLTLASLCVV